MKIGEDRVQQDRTFDYVPIASTVNNIVDLFQKFKYSGSKPPDWDDEIYVKHIQDKSGLRIAVCIFLPILGNFIVGVYDYLFSIKEPEPKEYAEVDPKTLPKEWELADQSSSIDAANLKSKALKETINFTDDKDRTLRVPIPATLRQYLAVTKQDIRCVELIRDQKGVLKLRLISEANFTEVTDPKLFKVDDDTFVLTLKKDDKLILFNDKTKQYISIPLKDYVEHSFTSNGLNIKRPEKPSTKTTPSLDLTKITKRWIAKEKKVEFSDGTNTLLLPLPSDVTETKNPHRYVELYEDPLTRNLQIRKIVPANFKDVTPKDINKLEFEGSTEDQSHLLILDRGRMVTVYNDRTKEYIDYTLPKSKKFDRYEFTDDNKLKIILKEREKKK